MYARVSFQLFGWMNQRIQSSLEIRAEILACFPDNCLFNVGKFVCCIMLYDQLVRLLSSGDASDVTSAYLLT
jgi:hypothetical protein